MLIRNADQLVMNEASYILARMVQTFEQLQRIDNEPWIESIGMGTTSANGIKVKLVPTVSHVTKRSAL